MRPAILTFLLLLAAVPRAQQTEFDILILGGRVLDGTGTRGWAWISVSGRGAGFQPWVRGPGIPPPTIAARGRHVTPGFIDVHSHAREGLEAKLNHAEPLLAQGITTAMLNPDGGGPVRIRITCR